MGKERWYLIFHREEEGKEYSSYRLGTRGATPDSIGRYHGLVTHQQERKV
jgi:hypothetical protein